jgi:hypothetical protein
VFTYQLHGKKNYGCISNTLLSFSMVVSFLRVFTSTLTSIAGKLLCKSKSSEKMSARGKSFTSFYKGLLQFGVICLSFAR